MALVLPSQGASSGAGLRNPIISAEWGWVGTECFCCPAPFRDSGGTTAVGQCRTDASFCPCSPEQPPNPTPLPLLPCPACCCSQQSQGFPVALFQSIIAPQRPGWWQNPPIRPHSSLPQDPGTVPFTRERSSDSCSLLGVPSPLTQGGRSLTLGNHSTNSITSWYLWGHLLALGS